MSWFNRGDKTPFRRFADYELVTLYNPDKVKVVLCSPQVIAGEWYYDCIKLGSGEVWWQCAQSDIIQHMKKKR